MKMKEGSAAARQWLENEGFKVAKEANRTKGCSLDGGDAYDPCYCADCKDAGELDGTFSWVVSWK